jgi:DNA transformation protein
MSTSESTISYLLDQLSTIKSVRARKMFGEYALYADEKVVALVCDDNLFVKITAEGKEFLGSNYEEGFAYKGAKASMQISGDLLEDKEFLCELISITTKALPMAKEKPKVAAKPTELLNAAKIAQGGKMKNGFGQGKRPIDNKQVTHNLRRRMGR